MYLSCSILGETTETAIELSLAVNRAVLVGFLSPWVGAHVAEETFDQFCKARVTQNQFLSNYRI